MGFHNSSTRAAVKPVYGALRYVARHRSPEAAFSIDLCNAVVDGQFECFDEIADSLVHPNDRQQALAAEITNPLQIPGGPNNHYGVLYLNRDANAQPVVMVSGFEENNTQIDAQIRAYFLAMTYRDSPVIIIDHSSHGLSSHYTAEEQTAMFGHGDLSGSGSGMAHAVEHMLKLYEMGDTIRMTSKSYGARVGFELALEGLRLGIGIRKLVAYESPGLFDKPNAKVFLNYFVDDLIQDRVRHSAEWLEEFKRLFGIYLDTYGRADRQRDLPNFTTWKNYREVRQNLASSVLRFGTGMETVRELAQNGVDMTLVHGEASRVTEASAVMESHRSDPLYRLVMIPHASHGFFGNVALAQVVALIDQSLMHEQSPPTMQELSILDFA